MVMYCTVCEESPLHEEYTDPEFNDQVHLSVPDHVHPSNRPVNNATTVAMKTTPLTPFSG